MWTIRLSMSCAVLPSESGSCGKSPWMQKLVIIDQSAPHTSNQTKQWSVSCTDRHWANKPVMSLCSCTTFHPAPHSLRGGSSGARQRLMHCVKAAIVKANNDQQSWEEKNKDGFIQNWMLFKRTGLAEVGDRKGGNRRGASMKADGICGSLAGTDPHCSTCILRSND